MIDEKNEYNYKDTLHLPKTDFPIRAQHAIYDPLVLQRWQEQRLSEATFFHNQGNETFILHDGPPYANGDIHLGHAFNKILKDIFTKFERMSGKHVPIIPGWDCHGLPVELKVTEQNPGLSGAALQKACRVYAQKWIDVQKQSFKNLGVLMHWDKPYTTMDYSYEASIVQAFGIFYSQGYIARQLKTVPWCASCQTVLANAEIEYEERKDPSIFVQFPLETALIYSLFPQVQDAPVSLLVWTTTPWTLPLNRAVVLKPDATYALVHLLDKYVIIAHALVEKIAQTVNGQATIITTFPASLLLGKQAQHPFIADLFVPIIGDGMTSLEEGTACVHCAPGCGPIDYELGIKNKLEIYSPVNPDGTYGAAIVPQALAGMSVDDGQIWVIKKLAESHMLFFKQSIRHSYPHCWRCHKGLIFRATSQWFCDLSKHQLKDRALAAIESIAMLPVLGKNRFRATLEGRLEWCLSRQRTWGVPIPAVRCSACGHVQTSQELIAAASQGIARDGIEFWDRVALADLDVAPCAACAGTAFEKEHDILDVWFESGVSHFAVLYHQANQAYPADLYLEGKDQHRAWFQSSLLTSLVLEQQVAMKSIVTHGFTVDERGRKMSKSLGNVVAPHDIVAKIGLDGLRLWVASCDYDSDPVYSDTLVQNVSEVYRKVRNTCRFLLSNIYDFDYAKDAIAFEHMLAIDQYALVRVCRLQQTILQAYADRKTTTFFHEIADYCVKDLSSFYLDVVKDRLYAQAADDRLRRSAQTACYYILDVLTKLIAPVMSCTAELVSDQYQRDKKQSIHLQDFVQTAVAWQRIMQHVAMPAHEYFSHWEVLAQVRTGVLKQLETLRVADTIRHSLDARITLYLAPDFVAQSFLKHIIASDQTLEHFFKEYFIVSQVELVTSVQSDMSEIIPGVFVKSDKAFGEKCARCWQWSDVPLQKALCPRCCAVLHIKS